VNHVRLLLGARLPLGDRRPVRRPPSASSRRDQPRIGWDIDVINAFADAGAIDSIPRITPALVFGTSEEALATVRAISRLLSGAIADDLAAVDEQMRSSRVFGDPYGDYWRWLEPDELSNWVGPGERADLVLRLSSLHSNGYVREAAVRRLAHVRDGSELPYLLLRLNDWVSEVRGAAESAVLDRAVPEYAKHFAANLGLIVRLQRTQRIDQRSVLPAIASLLATPVARIPMIALMSADLPLVRRAAFCFLAQSDPDDLTQVLSAALTVKDPVVRLWAARAAISRLKGQALRNVLDRLSSDRSGFVRREALAAWADVFPGDAQRRLVTALMDGSAGVRGEARFRLRESGVDFPQLYRDAMATDSPARFVTALSGLVETGDPTDAERLAPLLSHPIAKVRRVAVRGLLVLGGERYVESGLNALADEAHSVSWAAWSALAPYASVIAGSRLWAAVQTASPDHARRNALRVLARLPKWDAVPYLLLAAVDGDETLASLGRQYLRRWNAKYNRTQTRPTGGQVERLKQVLSETESLLPKALTSEIRFSVGSFESK
jgi:HEAT repeat protein